MAMDDERRSHAARQDTAGVKRGEAGHGQGEARRIGMQAGAG